MNMHRLVEFYKQQVARVTSEFDGNLNSFARGAQLLRGQFAINPSVHHQVTLLVHPCACCGFLVPITRLVQRMKSRRDDLALAKQALRSATLGFVSSKVRSLPCPKGLCGIELFSLDAQEDILSRYSNELACVRALLLLGSRAQHQLPANP